MSEDLAPGVLDEEKGSNSNEVKKKVDLDTIWIEEIGQFGWYQARFLAICFVFVILTACAGNDYVFTAARITSRCAVPECEDSPDSSDFYAPWVLNAIPGTSETSFESCARYFPQNNTFNPICPANTFDQSVTQSCNEYVYENTDTVVYDFNLACNEWRRTLIGSFKIGGYLTSLPISGYISDRWGRKVAFAINAFNAAWIGLIRYWTSSYWTFAVLQFCETALGSGFTAAYILVMEMLGPKYRVYGGAFMNTCFSIGQMVLGLLALGIPQWQNLTLAIYIPHFVTLSLFWIISESVRWLMSKGRYDESEKILKNIAKVNRKNLSDKSLENLRFCHQEERKRQEEEAGKKDNEPSLPALLMMHKKVLLRVVVAPVWWITCTFVYYGLSINAVSLTGSRYLNYIIVAAVDIPGYWLAVFLLSKIGRKIVLISSYWICCGCMIGYIFVSSSAFAASLSLYLISKFAIASVIVSLYVYTVELYPTQYRNTLFASSSMIGRVGAIVAPLTPALGEALFPEFPYVMFASLSLVSGALIFLTPETLGTKLPDTMQEAADLRKIDDKT